MVNKPPHSITDQIALLQSRGMLFKSVAEAPHFLKNISYYRLKGYWWDTQADYTLHTFKPGTCFEDIIERYNFDRHLRLILFDAIERIEIALRSKMVYHLAMKYGGLWYLKASLFDNKTFTYNKVAKRNTFTHLTNWRKNSTEAKKYLWLIIIIDFLVRTRMPGKFWKWLLWEPFQSCIRV